MLNGHKIKEPTSNNKSHLAQMLSFKVNSKSKLMNGIIDKPGKLIEAQNVFFEHSNIHIPIIIWNNEIFMRISIQAYNSIDDIEKLIKALKYFNLL